MCVCECVWGWVGGACREMKARKEIVRAWQRRWQLSASVFDRPGIPHKPGTSHMPTIPMHMCTMDHTAYIILTTATVVLSLLHSTETKILDLKLKLKVKKYIYIDESVLNWFPAHLGYKIPAYIPKWMCKFFMTHQRQSVSLPKIVL